MSKTTAQLSAWAKPIPKPIAITSGNWGGKGPGSVSVLYDDGTVWIYRYSGEIKNWVWEKLPPIPTDQESSGSEDRSGVNDE